MILKIIKIQKAIAPQLHRFKNKNPVVNPKRNLSHPTNNQTL
jgi:hypothetical protein